MTDILLVSAADAKSRMAIASDILGIDAVLESAIKAAQLRVEAELDSKLERKSYSDTFHLDPEYFADVTPGGLLRMQLRSGLLRTDVPVAITIGSAWHSCTEETDASLLRIDHERGIIYADRETYQGKYCRVVYEAGYDVDEAVPGWLSEAVTSYIPVIWNFGQPSNRTPEADKQAQQSGDHAMAILTRYQRNIGFTYRPVF